jgi:polar amino acid transport system permease protein
MVTQMSQATIVEATASNESVPTLHTRPRYGRWISATILVVAAGSFLYSLYKNENLQVHAIRQYLFNDEILHGVAVTLELTAICFVLGLLGGLVLAVMRLSDNPVSSIVSAVYVWVFRSIPPLVQLIFWAFFAALYPRLTFGVPFTSVEFVDVRTNSVIGPFMAAVIGLTLIEIAYTAEVIRGGISGVDRGQALAARALGMGGMLTLQKVVLPQAMPSIVPPLGNNLVNLVKATSLVSVIGGAELMTQVQNIYGQNYAVIPLLSVAAIWYLAITGVLTIAQSLIERHYSKGARSMGGGKANRAVAAGAPEL